MYLIELTTKRSKAVTHLFYGTAGWFEPKSICGIVWFHFELDHSQAPICQNCVRIENAHPEWQGSKQPS